MQLAPDFELLDDSGYAVRLSEFRDKNWVVLFFYPKDGTPLCSVEVCAFREKYETFVSAGAVLLGISPDSTQEHRSFRQRFRLPFKLLSDEGNLVREAYGVPRMLGLLPGRGTYIISPKGSIEYSFLGQFDPCKHADTALRIILKNTPNANPVGNPYRNVLLPAMKHVVQSYVAKQPQHTEHIISNFLKQNR